MKIILDAMGGDHAPQAPVLGAIEAAKAYGSQITLVGRGEEILNVLKQNGIETLPAGIEIANAENYTQDPAVAEKWIQEYRVTVHNSVDGGDKIPRTSPHARLIDIASNDLMKFQKGVFLLLTDFNLVNKMYLTKNVRGDFRIVKHTINRDICGQITDLIEAEAPWYSFKNLMDISSGLNSAISSNSTLE